MNFPPNWFTVPRFYTSNPLNMTGPDAEIAWPGFAESLDYELELTVVLGVGGKDIAASRHRGIAASRHRGIAASRARDHIFGVTLFNDFTARDTQVAVSLGTFVPMSIYVPGVNYSERSCCLTKECYPAKLSGLISFF
ncbi:fumarylacetoacetate hydrolase family protein [Variovorax paradoxus]|uniref:fumarylacetoacetate hydrolase family protein n=1 Tax=Variovorax paradoxus TaxID=34073 RepID=UPI00155EFD87